MTAKFLRNSALIAATAAGALVAAFFVWRADGSTAISTTTATVAVARADQATSTTSATESVSQIYRKNVAGIVEIRVRTTSTSNGISPFGPQPQSQEAQGTGFEIDDSGDIVTNAHVVSGANSITVETNAGKSYKATLVGSDETTDVAVIHISAPADSLDPLTFGDSANVSVGDAVVAIGDPYGLTESVTTGIVSALGRTITSPNNHPIENAIQTDAAINHGNSGGPLFNDQGQVIGITSQIYTDQNTGGGNVGIGFAVPASTVAKITNEILKTGKASHPYIGVYLTDISSAEASAAGVRSGVEITRVTSGSPGAEAGLRAASGQSVTTSGAIPTGGDYITAIDGRTVRTAAQVIGRISAMKPGDTVKLTIQRRGQATTVAVTLGSD